MANLSLVELLDKTVEVILTHPAAPLPRTDGAVAPLIQIAVDLRDLPRQEFRAHLKMELQGKGSMEKETIIKPIREGFRTVTPYIAVPEAQQVIEFVQRAFGAVGKIYGIGSQGGVHSEYRIGDSMLMIGGGETRRMTTPNPAALHLYVEDVDAVYARALQEGATSLMGPTDQDYGDRDAAIKDAGGNHWYIATHKGDRYLPEGSDNLMPYLHPRGAPKMIDFLKQAFQAEEIAVYQGPDGTVHHAKVRIGNSIVEMGEAHEQWQPISSMFMLYVEDADGWYARAMKAEGAISMGKPADQPYGDRVGTVKDPFDNIWYIATPTKGSV